MSAEVVLKKYQVPGTVPSGKPPKSELYRTVSCRTMQWKSAKRKKDATMQDFLEMEIDTVVVVVYILLK